MSPVCIAVGRSPKAFASDSPLALGRRPEDFDFGFRRRPSDRRQQIAQHRLVGGERGVIADRLGEPRLHAAALRQTREDEQALRGRRDGAEHAPSIVSRLMRTIALLTDSHARSVRCGDEGRARVAMRSASVHIVTSRMTSRLSTSGKQRFFCASRALLAGGDDLRLRRRSGSGDGAADPGGRIEGQIFLAPDNGLLHS